MDLFKLEPSQTVLIHVYDHNAEEVGVPTVANVHDAIKILDADHHGLIDGKGAIGCTFIGAAMDTPMPAHPVMEGDHVTGIIIDRSHPHWKF